jgi:phosphoribosyl-dephospho-CoA transferase
MNIPPTEVQVVQKTIEEEKVTEKRGIGVTTEKEVQGMTEILELTRENQEIITGIAGNIGLQEKEKDLGNLAGIDIANMKGMIITRRSYLQKE